MNNIILISAKAKTGKDTFAENFKKKLIKKGYTVGISHYASYLKNILYEYFDWDGVKTDEVRTALQTLGTDIIRNKMGKINFHVNRLCEDIDIVKDYFDFIVIPDCRFENEITFLESYFPNTNVIKIRIERQFKKDLTQKQSQHESETELDNYDKWNYHVTLNSIQDTIDFADKLISDLEKKGNMKCSHRNFIL